MRVHLQLESALADELRGKTGSPQDFQDLLDGRIAAALPEAKIANINLKRFARHGLLSANVDGTTLEQLRALPDVKWVEEDSVKVPA
jgi:hypothetical protein